MKIDERIEEIEATLSSKGWKLIKEKFMQKKAEYQELVMETSPLTEEGANNILHYQAMFNAIDEFYDMTRDMMHNLKNPGVEV